MAGSLNWIFTFLSILTVPRIAKFMAQKRKEKAVEHVAQAAWVALLAGTATMLLLSANVDTLLQSARPLPPALRPAARSAIRMCTWHVK